MKIDYSRFSVAVCFLFLWQILQVLVALIILAILHNKPVKYKNEHSGMTVWRVHHSFGSCWSMGPFIFVPDKQPEKILRHESGHSIQSVYLGPLYLLFVGLPSACLLGYQVSNKKDYQWYHSHYPENWADKLGGVNELQNKG